MLYQPNIYQNALTKKTSGLHLDQSIIYCQKDKLLFDGNMPRQHNKAFPPKTEAFSCPRDF